jgi:hypothetical protein
VVEEERRLYEGPAHRWELPVAARPASFALLVVAAWAVAVEAVLVVGELLVHGYVLADTARGFAAAGIVFLVLGNLKTVLLAVGREANEALTGLLDIVLPRLWLAHFWLNPLGVLSLGLFLLFAPRAQPPFYYIAYGVLLWQTASGLAAREAVPLRGDRAHLGRTARAAHHQPVVYVLLLVLVAAGFVDALFP